jgi:8-oxo-dGTP pyrophosphatase MutT (NUDIX family)
MRTAFPRGGSAAAFSMLEARDFFLKEGSLSSGDAAVALIVVDDSRYLLQLRDQKPGIFYPGHWGLFGGALDLGETPGAALRRELREELGFSPREVSYFTEFTFDFAPHGGRRVLRRYYEVHVCLNDVASMKLGEGADLRVFSADELLGCERVTPYDSMAIWMHATRAVHAGKHVRTRPY